MSAIQSKLHDFDLELCNYLRCNIRLACKNASVMSLFRDEIGDPLLAYLGLDGKSTDDLCDDLLLSYYDLEELKIEIENAGTRADWDPYPQLHRRAVLCIKEIRDELSRQDAEDWSELSRHCREQLERPSLLLAKGCDIINEWIRAVRRLLIAMEKMAFVPRPEGQFPTPSNPHHSGSALADPIATSLPVDCNPIPSVPPSSQSNDAGSIEWPPKVGWGFRAGEAAYNSVSFPVTVTESKILEYLWQKRGNPVSISDLRLHAWNDDSMVEESTIRSVLSGIRSRIRSSLGALCVSNPISSCGHGTKAYKLELL